MNSHTLRLALVFIALTMNGLGTARSQDIQGELLAVDAVRARNALEARLGVEAAAGYVRVQAGCGFPPCTDVQERSAVFEQDISSTPEMSRRRRMNCSGRRQQPWTCGAPQGVATVTRLARTISLSESISEPEALAVLEFLDSDCLAAQKAAFPVARQLPTGAALAARLGAIRTQDQGLRVTTMMELFSFYRIDLRRSTPGSACPFELTGIGLVII